MDYILDYDYCTEVTTISIRDDWHAVTKIAEWSAEAELHRTKSPDVLWSLFATRRLPGSGPGLWIVPKDAETDALVEQLVPTPPANLGTKDVTGDIMCRRCGYLGGIKTYYPAIVNDCCCPRCGSTNNEHNRKYTDRVFSNLRVRSA